MRTKTLTHVTRFGRRDTFRVIDRFPEGAIIWPIGRENFPFEGFIPVAYPKNNPEYEWMQGIDTTRLMAIECKDEQTALALLKHAVKGNYKCTAKELYEAINK